MLKELRGSDVIIECLLEQGVDTVFGYPGGAVLNIYDSLYKYSDKIHHVITAHEQAACHAVLCGHAVHDFLHTRSGVVVIIADVFAVINR